MSTNGRSPEISDSLHLYFNVELFQSALTYFSVRLFQCIPLDIRGLRRGGYHCHCHPGYHLSSSALSSPTNHSLARNYFPGSQVESFYVAQLLNSQSPSSSSGGWSGKEEDAEEEEEDGQHPLRCESCRPGCVSCIDNSPCSVENDLLLRSIPLLVESLSISFDVVLVIVIVWMRKAKVGHVVSSSFPLHCLALNLKRLDWL